MWYNPPRKKEIPRQSGVRAIMEAAPVAAIVRGSPSTRWCSLEVRSMTQIKKGDKAPGFALPDPAGKTVTLGDFGGRKLLVYFFPKAGTSG